MKKNKKLKNKESNGSKLLIISIIFLIGTIGIFSYSLLKNKFIENDIKKLKNDIQENKLLISDNDNNKTKLEDEYTKLQEELKNKVDEYNVWKKIKEKLVK